MLDTVMTVDDDSMGQMLSEIERWGNGTSIA